MTLNQLLWKLTKEKFHEVILGGQQKCLQSSQNNATYKTMNRDTDITYKTVIIFISDNVLSASFLMFHITWCMWNNDMFILWNHISAIFYEDRECCFTHLAKTFKWTYQVDPLLKNECNTCSPSTHFCK